MKKIFLLITITVVFFSCSDKHLSSLNETINYCELLSRNPDNEIAVINCDKPYEKELSFPTILKVGNKYVMYYVVYNGLGARNLSTCYAESTDGINWVKPDLGLVEFNGNKNNNIISNDFEGVCVEYNKGQFYLLTYAADFKTYLYKSTDGKQFSKIESFNIPYTCDSQNQIIFDQLRERYKIYLRSWYKSENSNIKYNHTDSLYRSVSLLETEVPESVNVLMSDNPLWRWGENSGIPPALNFELPMVMYNTSDEDYDIYNSCIHQYWDNSFIAYPIIYHHLPEPSQGGNAYNDGYTRLGMWSSVDGIKFEIITNDYFNFGELYFEFALGHIETDYELIHYYVKFNKTHGDINWDNSTQIIARIHKK